MRLPFSHAAAKSLTWSPYIHWGNLQRSLHSYTLAGLGREREERRVVEGMGGADNCSLKGAQPRALLSVLALKHLLRSSRIYTKPIASLI